MLSKQISKDAIIVFAYDPTIYFNIKYKNYEFLESFFYINSSKEHSKIIEIFNEVNK